jgi:phage FluMu gp28-like protein
LSPTDRQSKNLFSKVVSFLRCLKEKPELKEDNIHSMTFASGSRITSLPGNNADTIRGYSAPALVVLDEAAFINDALYTALRPMLAVGRGRFVMLTTPNGKRGAFYDAWSSNGSDWRRIEVRAEQCPRIGQDFLAEERQALGDMLFGQEYQCQFVAASDQYFSEAAIQKAFATAGEPIFANQAPAVAPDHQRPFFAHMPNAAI